jgi:hypothetical protein
VNCIMAKSFFISCLCWLLLAISCLGQTANDLSSSKTNTTKFTGNEIKGSVLDSADQAALPYATIYILHKNKGAISNENGEFAIDISGLEKTDTVCFQYIGYKTKKLLIGQIEATSVFYLNEEIYDLNETLIFGNPPDPLTIVKKVIKNKDANYQKTTCTRQTFIRQREIIDFDSFKLNYKQSTIPDLNEETLKLLEDNIPKQTISYTDFLGNVYITKNPDDSVRLKFDPVRTVSLKEKEYDELEKFDTIFENLFATTDEKEYWKIKSGIFSQKIDTPEENTDPVEDTIGENQRKSKYFASSIESQLKYCTLEDEDQWEFLYETGKYDYTLAGGTSFNGENVYIIDFTPDYSGHYTGRLYISVETYALIRADYEYAPGKTGRDIHLLGVGYTETGFSGSIYFEKKNNNYLPKYFSTKTGTSFSVTRKVEIAKKKKGFLFDKEIMDFDLALDISANTESSIELYNLDDKEITEEQFNSFKQPELYEIIYVDQFDDNLWSGYSIIEPTRRMKEYKKQK